MSFLDNPSNDIRVQKALDTMQTWCELIIQQKVKEEQEEKNIAEKAANHRTHTPEFDQFQPPQYPVSSQPPEESIKEFSVKHAQEMITLVQSAVAIQQHEQTVQKEQEEQATFTPYWKFPIFDEDDDEYTFQYKEYLENSSNAITPYLSAKEPDNSLSMGDEHLDIIPETESDELIKSSVENLVPIPSESEVFSDNESECDVLVGDDFTTFSNPLFDSDDDFSSSDDESFSDENVPKENFKIYSNSLFDEEIISSKIDPHHFNAESDLIESLLNRDISTVSYPKIDSLFEEFSGELAHVDLIPPGINEAYFDSEEDIRLVEKSLDKNSSPRPPEELNSEISDAIIESFSPIPVEDSDSLREEIDIFLALDDSIPPGIGNDNYDSEGDDLFLKELLNNDFISLPEYESFHFDSYNVPSSPRPPEKPPDDDGYLDIEPDMGVLTTKVVVDISDNSTREPRVQMPNVLPTHPTFCQDLDFTFSTEFSGSILVVSFPSGNRNKTFDPGISIEVQSKRFLSLNEFSISFISDPLSLVLETLLPFSSKNEDKVFNPGILVSKEEKSPHLLSHRGFKAFKNIHNFLNESPMMIYGGDIPIWDVPYLHFDPP
ncbi:hypothetical protein Tco_0008591 [Tanacetum coccineum]